jgi:tRNA A37 threonylcarbamoyladenosine modification protein TsaB
VAGDARRREVYWAVYHGSARLSGPAVDKPDLVAVRAAEEGVTRAAGAGAELYAETLGLPLLSARYPSVLALVELAADRIRGAAPSESLTPLYLRRPDAVEPAARKPFLG